MQVTARAAAPPTLQLVSTTQSEPAVKILLAVDGSPFTRRMLAYLSAHDELLGVHHAFTVLHAVPPLLPRAVVMVDKHIVQDYYDEGIEKVFKPIRTFLDKRGIKASYQSRIGAAGELIAKEAEKGKFDLVVLGSHGHGALGSLLMGSVAAQVMARCKVPLLLVR
jgi:nucleotide-binding universal stress UspA family protein